MILTGHVAGLCFQCYEHQTLTRHLKVTIDLRKNSKYIEKSCKCAIDRNVHLLNIGTIVKYTSDNSDVTSKIRFARFHGFNI